MQAERRGGIWWIPLRVAANAFGWKVTWNMKNREVVVGVPVMLAPRPGRLRPENHPTIRYECDPPGPYGIRPGIDRENTGMSAVLSERSYTPDDLLAIDDGRVYELVRGALVEKPMGAYSSWVAGVILRYLAGIAEERGLGWVLPPDTGYQCFPNEPQKVRKPDVSLIRRGRLPGERIPDGHIRIAPDLVVEVISPNDRFYEVDAKVSEYLAAGIAVVWVVNPDTRTVQVHHGDYTSERLQASDELTLPELLPEFRCRVADLFAPVTE